MLAQEQQQVDKRRESAARDKGRVRHYKRPFGGQEFGAHSLVFRQGRDGGGLLPFFPLQGGRELAQAFKPGALSFLRGCFQPVHINGISRLRSGPQDAGGGLVKAGRDGGMHLHCRSLYSGFPYSGGDGRVDGLQVGNGGYYQVSFQYILKLARRTVKAEGACGRIQLSSRAGPAQVIGSHCSAAYLLEEVLRFVSEPR